jgi:hypothetical protein
MLDKRNDTEVEHVEVVEKFIDVGGGSNKNGTD